MTLRRYIVQRALLLPPMLLGITLLTFILSHAVPARVVPPVRRRARFSPHPSSSTVSSLGQEAAFNGKEEAPRRAPRGLLPVLPFHRQAARGGSLLVGQHVGDFRARSGQQRPMADRAEIHLHEELVSQPGNPGAAVDR